jgi:hypothetical protein
MPYLIAVLLLLISACAPKSQIIPHFQQRIEHTHKANWDGSSLDILTACDKTVVVGVEGNCPGIIQPTVQMSPGWLDRTFASLSQMAATVPSALILNNGMRNIPASNVTMSNANTADSSGSSASAVSNSQAFANAYSSANMRQGWGHHGGYGW